MHSLSTKVQLFPQFPFSEGNESVLFYVMNLAGSDQMLWELRSKEGALFTMTAIIDLLLLLEKYLLPC
jgi:hypothetical protein